MAGVPRQWPQSMAEASTHSSVLRDRSTAPWLYYEMPVRRYLLGLGCGRDAVDDLTHDLLIRLQTYILLNYDGVRPFRPYLKTAIRNFYFSHCGRDHTPAAIDPADLPVDGDSDDGDLDALQDYARHVYQLFVREVEPRMKPAAELLHRSIIDDVAQEVLARELKVSDRRVRTRIAEAADLLSRWIDRRINRADRATLVRLARLSGVPLPSVERGLRGLFTHPSRDKRLHVLMILAYIYRHGVVSGTG
jgi:DNA-directed RNA polymerase specialized sigma24 family protein